VTRTSIGTRNRFRLRYEFGRDTTPDPGRYSDSDTGLDSDPDPTPIVTTASSSETNLPGVDQLAHESARRNTHTQRRREISVALIGRTTGAISAASSNNRRAIGSESSRIAFLPPDRRRRFEMSPSTAVRLHSTLILVLCASCPTENLLTYATETAGRLIN